MNLKMMGAGAARATEAWPLNLFQATGNDIGISRSGTDYWLHYAIAPSDYVSVLISSYSGSGETEHSIFDLQTSVLLIYVDDAAAGCTKVGSWTNQGGAYYGGTRAYSVTAGNSATFTTGAGTIGVWYANTSPNQGILKVLIDGDATLATNLPTAQDLVDAGTLADTVLVANGGTLNPTDRCMDPYALGLGTHRLDGGLSAGVHTVQFVLTAYKNALSTTVRIFVDYLAYTTATLTLAGATSFLENETMSPGGSVFEYALNYKPTGAAANEWAGNRHSNDSQTALTLYVDGAEVSLDDGEIVSGNSVQIVRASNLLHSESGATVNATVALTYTLSKTTGLTVSWTMTWNVNATYDTALSSMFPLPDAVFDRGTTELSAINLTLTDNDMSHKGTDSSKQIWMWDTDGTLGAIITVTVTPSSSYIEDRSGSPALNKAYFVRNVAPITAGDIWTYEANYRVQRFVSADTSLAK